jgi:two-component system sensor histidine kinase RegB
MHIRLPLAAMGVMLAALVAGNLLTLLRLRWARPVTNSQLFVALTFDAVILTALLYLSGGATNPFTLLYLLQVILGAVLLETWAVWAMIVVTLLCFIVLIAAYRPLALPTDGPGPFALYIQGAVVAFALNAVLLVTFISRINANLRLRDQRLAALRQRAAEEDHIVRMGLLASGAAHELGTPLATLDVILADWRRMPRLAKDPEILSEIEEMRSEVARCKAIVTGVLVSAGEVRGEAASVSGLKAYLQTLFDEWKVRRSTSAAVYEDGLRSDPAIVADSALKQALCNLLDNAFEVSPQAVWMRARLEGDELALRIQDAGPGFTPQTLAEIGKPYNSTKGRLGGGLGLFLVVNVARKMGGRVEARNRDTGGAEVTITLPLSTLAIEAVT